MKKTRKNHRDDPSPALNGGRLFLWAADPLNILSLLVFLVWGSVGIWFRPIGDFGVETDFFGDFVPHAAEWIRGHPSVMDGYRGPFYYLLVGALSILGDTFLMAKLLSAAAAALGIRFLGGLLRNLWGPVVALAGILFLLANQSLIQYIYRASTDLVYWALFTGTLALLFSPGNRPYRTWILAGLCAGLAYLTRYNGIALLGIGLVAGFTLLNPRKHALRMILAFLAAWLLVASPWLLFLWNQTGDPFWNRNFALVAEEVYGTDPVLANIGHLVDSVGFQSLGEVFQLDPGRFLGNMAGNLPRHLWMDIKLLVGPAWAVFSLAGFALSLGDFRDRRRLVFMVGGLITYLSLLPVFYNPRFMLSLLVWWAAGAGMAASFVTRWIGRRVPPNTGTYGAIFRTRIFTNVMLVALALLAIQATYVGFRRSQGSLGGPAMPLAVLKLADSVQESGFAFAEDTPVAARKPHIGYFLGTPMASLSNQGHLEDLAATGVHYLLVSDIECRIFPSLTPMLSDRRPAQEFPGYRFLAGIRHRDKSGTYQTAALYSVENPAPATETAVEDKVELASTPEDLDRLDYLRSNLARWYMNWTVDQPLLPLFSRMNPASRSHPFVRQIEGDAHLAVGNYQQAESTYRDNSTGSTPLKETLARMALAQYLAGNQEGWQRHMMEYASQWETDEIPGPDDWMNEAANLARAGKYIPAAALLTQFRSLDPESSIAEDYRMLGYCYLNFRHYDHARQAFARYLERVPGDPEILDILKDDSRLVRP